MKENQTISSWILEQCARYHIIKDLEYFELDKQWIGNWITTQQEKTSKANKETCILMKILASIYLLESFTWIPIQILYVHGHFKDITQYETTCIYDQTLIMSLGRLWSAPLHACLVVLVNIKWMKKLLLVIALWASNIQLVPPSTKSLPNRLMINVENCISRSRNAIR